MFKKAKEANAAFISQVRITLFRLEMFYRRHRHITTALAVVALMGSAFIMAVPTPAHAAAEGDMLAEIKNAAFHMSDTKRGVISSSHYLAWNRWVGFTPSTSSNYVVSGSSVISGGLNIFSTLFFAISGLVIRTVGMVAAVGLSFEPLEAVMYQVERNMVTFGAFLIPWLKSDYERLCAEGNGVSCGVLTTSSTGLYQMISFLVFAFALALFFQLKRRSGKGQIGKFMRQAGDAFSTFSASYVARQVILTVTALSMLFVLSVGAANDIRNISASEEPGEGSPSTSSPTQLSPSTSASMGSPRWFAGWLESGAVKAADLIGVGTNAAATVLTGRSLKTGPSVGGACSAYVGALHATYQNGETSKSRDQFLLALDELTLNSYIRLVVNSTIGPVDDTLFTGAGNAWCHRLEYDAKISGAEHMLMTRLALALEDSDIQDSSDGGSPLAASIDANISGILSGDKISQFAALKSIENMWAPQTNPSAANEATFYFAACNTYYGKPKLLDSWANVITADAIKTSNGISWGKDSSAVVVPIGGTRESRIYLENSVPIGDISKELGKSGDNVDKDAICGAIATGNAVRNPLVARPLKGKTMTKWAKAEIGDFAYSMLGFTGSRQSSYTAGIESANKIVQSGWKGGYRSAGDSMVAVAPDSGMDYKLLNGFASEVAKQPKLIASNIPGVGSDGTVSAEDLYNAIESFNVEALQDPSLAASISMMVYASSGQNPPDTGDDWATWLGKGAVNIASYTPVVGPVFDWLGKKVWGTEEEQEAQQEKKNAEAIVAGLYDLTTQDTGAGKVARAALTGFGKSQASVAKSFDWREPDIEFLGIGVRNMSSAAPLFVKASNNGPYDYYLKNLGNDAPSMLVNALCSLLLAVMIAKFILPLVVGIVLSKVLSVFAWFAAGFVLILNVIPYDPFRALLKLFLATIIWSQISTSFFTGILKVMTMLIVVFNAVLYNPTHPTLIQTTEIMLSIIAAFGITKFILSKYFAVDLTSFKGAAIGAAVGSGKQFFDTMDKPLGLFRDTDDIDLGDMNGLKEAAKGAFNSAKDKFSNAGKDDQDQRESDDAAVFDPQGIPGDTTDSTDNPNGADSADMPEGTEGENSTYDPTDMGEIPQDAKSLASSPNDELVDGYEPPEGEGEPEVSDHEKAQQLMADIAPGAGVLSDDEMDTPDQIRAAFEENTPEAVAAQTDALFADEDRDHITDVATGAEVLGGTGANVGTGIDNGDGTKTAIQDAHAVEGGNDSLTHNNKFTAAINADEESGGDLYSDEETAMLRRASALSDDLNSVESDRAGEVLSEEDRQWLREHDEELAELLARGGVATVNDSDANHISGAMSADTIAPVSPESFARTVGHAEAPVETTQTVEATADDPDALMDMGVAPVQAGSVDDLNTTPVFTDTPAPVASDEAPVVSDSETLARIEENTSVMADELSAYRDDWNDNEVEEELRLRKKDTTW